MNQRMNASQGQTTSSNLTDVGWVAVRTRASGELVDRLMSPVGEATVKACGVAVAKPQGHSWAPHLSNGSGVNVGTIAMVPLRHVASVAGGKVCRRLMPPRWGGGVVVVRGRESRSHGEGPQRVCSEVAGEYRRSVAGSR